MFNCPIRLVSAFRDKLERCHRPDCVLDNDWSDQEKIKYQSANSQFWDVIISMTMIVTTSDRYYQTYGKEMVARQREGAIVRFGKEHFRKR